MKIKPFSLSEKIVFITAVVVIFAAAVAASVYINKGRDDTFNGGMASPSDSFSSYQTVNSDERIVALEKLSDEGKYEEAEKTAEEIIKTNPNEDTLVDALWELTLAESAQGKFEEAIEHANSVGKYESSSSHYLLGLIYIDNKDYTKAKEELNLAKKEDPDLKDEIDSFIEQLDGITG